METPLQKKKARWQFFGLYLLSLILIFIVVSAFWKASGEPAAIVDPENSAMQQGTGDETEKLKQLLAQKEERILVLEQLGSSGGNDKDKLILSLQNQLREKEAALQQLANAPAQTNTGNDSELKQKYASLKTAYEKTAASENALKAAYKTVAEDNRRLLNQLQTLRSEKKN
jgi:hypothetical protein